MRSYSRGLMTAFVSILLIVVLCLSICSEAKPIYLDETQSVNDRVADLLAKMTLEEKIGQMTQVERNFVNPDVLSKFGIGSILSGGGSAPNPNTATSWADMIDGFQKNALNSRLKIPMIYGSDAVHGHNNLHGAVMYPHNIGLGCTRNKTLAVLIGKASAEEIAGSGVHWTFAPCLAVPRNERWGRTYEGFGEDPSVVEMMSAMVTGLQGEQLGKESASVLATAKHWIGDGGTDGGKDQGDTKITDQELRKIHLPGYIGPIKSNVATVMASFSSVNGKKCHGNIEVLTNLLKKELGFKGFVISDWAGIDQLSWDYNFVVRTSVNAGMDMVMVPDNYQRFMDTLKVEVNKGNVTMERIDDACTRILTKKFEMGLFENPMTNRTLTGTVGSDKHKQIAREAVRQSLVLLKNDNRTLPLKNKKKIFVAGKNANDMGNQCGGWTITWQGSSGDVTPGTTILDGIKASVNSSITVSYDRYGNGVDKSYDVAVVVIGETPYAEGRGDKPGNIGIEDEDKQVLAKMKQAGVPVVVVLVSGRPLVIEENLLKDMNALVAAWLPGTEGGGVADVLFGAYKPTGKLSHTWPKTEQQIPINFGDSPYDPLFAFGYGLTYE